MAALRDAQPDAVPVPALTGAGIEDLRAVTARALARL
jgi:hypothetical protein